MKKFCIIGLGHFGYNLSLRLAEGGAEVLAVDRVKDKVDEISDKVTYAVCMDTSDEKALRSLSLTEMDAVVVAIGENFESSLMTTAILQEIGVKKIYNRVITRIHERLLRLMNVDELLLPEANAAEDFAKKLLIPGILKSFTIGKEYGVFEINAPKSFINKTLVDLNLRQNFSLNLITLNRKKEITSKSLFGSKTDYDVIGVPKPDTVILEGDILVLFGQEKNVKELLEK
jgi:trk system potassium uptake protein TrkA